MIEKFKKIPNYINTCKPLNQWLHLMVWICFALMYVYICIPGISVSNSLYYPSDSSVFHMIGKLWLEGVLPYRDLFDHKGPVLYMFYALGHIIWAGKGGVFLLLSICLGIAFFYEYRIARLFVGRFESIIITLSSIFLCGSMYSGLSEDFSLPFIVIPLYYFLRYLIHDRKASSINSVHWLLAGLCFGVIVLIRPNNAAVLCAAVAFFGFKIIFEKKYVALIRAIILLVIGTLVVCIPTFALFYANGTLYDCIYGSYIFNFLFAGQGIAEKTLNTWLKIVEFSIPFWTVLIFGLILVKKKILARKIYVAELFISFFSMLCLIPGKTYPHYFIFYSPCLIFALICSLQFIQSLKRKSHYLYTFLILAVGYSHFAISSLAIIRYGIYGAFFPLKHDKHAKEVETLQTCKSMRSVIPDNEKNSVLYFGGQGNVYLYMGVTPPIKYFMLQDFLWNFGDSIKVDMEKEFKGNKAPKWVIVRDFQLSEIENTPLPEYLRNYCEEVKFQDAESEFKLFRRKSSI